MTCSTGARTGRVEVPRPPDLERLSTFHVKRFPGPYLLTRPVSAHRRARRGPHLELSVIVREVAEARSG